MGLFETLKRAVVTAETKPTPELRPFTKPQSIPGPDTQETKTSGIGQRILFVGGEACWYQGIQHEITTARPNWQSRKVETPADGVSALASDHFHAVVLGNKAADDASLTQSIEKHSGHVLRVVLCEGDDRAGLTRWNKPGVTPLPKSTDAKSLVSNISRALRLQSWTTDAGLKKLLSSLRKLPAMPKLYSQVTAELSSPNGSIEIVARFIAQDPVMTAKILQLVNSAFFALGREVSDPQEAVVFLGAERTRSLILLAGVFTQFDDVKCPGFSADAVWNHSLQVAAFARTIAMAELKNAKAAEAAYTAGLVHDMGKLILAANVPTMCSSIDSIQHSKHLVQRDAELQVLGTTHAELAACLLGAWGLPLPVLEAVAWHHCPLKSDDNGFSLLAAVHVANAFAHESENSPSTNAPSEKMDHDYLIQVQLADRPNLWREACKLPLKPDEVVTPRLKTRLK